MIKIRYSRNNGGEQDVIRLPEVIATAVSGRLRDLCKFKPALSFTAKELLGDNKTMKQNSADHVSLSITFS